MLENFLSIAHIVPLAIIATSVVFNLVAPSRISKHGFNALLLLLSSIGICAGSFTHDHHTTILLDPCFGYAATLLFVAVRIMVDASSKVQLKR